MYSPLIGTESDFNLHLLPWWSLESFSSPTCSFSMSHRIPITASHFAMPLDGAPTTAGEVGRNEPCSGEKEMLGKKEEKQLRNYSKECLEQSKDFPDGKYPARGKSAIEDTFPPLYFEWFQFDKISLCTSSWKNASHTYANTLLPMVLLMVSLASHR
ncbi:hypothetical protein VNO77_20023 [Canavalia gladiata]|uniref:Uncharacterized protein n=1 Tax=Canavalia gladiata TaxID=3824 RepID=A0AAN9QL13_CANGL